MQKKPPRKSTRFLRWCSAQATVHNSVPWMCCALRQFPAKFRSVKNECVHGLPVSQSHARMSSMWTEKTVACRSREVHKNADPFKRRIQIEVNFEFETETGFGTLWNLNEMHKAWRCGGTKTWKLQNLGFSFKFNWDVDNSDDRPRRHCED